VRERERLGGRERGRKGGREGRGSARKCEDASVCIYVYACMCERMCVGVCATCVLCACVCVCVVCVCVRSHRHVIVRVTE